MPEEMRIRIWDVEHGACATVQHVIRAELGEHGGRLAIIDSGHGTGFRPSEYITNVFARNRLDYLYINTSVSKVRTCASASFAAGFPTSLRKLDLSDFDLLAEHGYRVALKIEAQYGLIQRNV